MSETSAMALSDLARRLRNESTAEDAREAESIALAADRLEAIERAWLPWKSKGKHANSLKKGCPICDALCSAIDGKTP